MDRITQKRVRQARRKKRVRKKIFGTADMPRLSVFRSLNHIYVQAVDDVTGTTLASASTRSKALSGSVGFGGNVDSATKVGQSLAEGLKAKGVKQVAFDRNGYRFHGRVKALAQAVRDAGIQF
jgi:large subunit ribosomal protein L18